MASALSFVLLVVAGICMQAALADWRSRCYSKKADIVFIMDESHSIIREDFTKQKEFIVNLINHFDVSKDGTHIGLISFGTTPMSRFYMKDDADYVKRKVMGINQRGGNTYTWLALQKARRETFDPWYKSRRGDPTVPLIAIVITDGDSQDPAATAKAARELRDSGVTVFAIGVGTETQIKGKELLAIAGSADNKFRVENYDKLQNIENQVLVAACVTETPPTVPPTTLPPVVIPQPCRDKEADVLLVMDESENGRPIEVEGMKDFLGRLVYSLDIGKTRVGFITYSRDATLQFGFEQYNNHYDIYSAIQGVQANFLPQANLGEAFKMADRQNFNPDKGGRTKVAKVVVLITPGRSSDSSLSARMAAQLKQNRGVRIIAVALASANQEELSSIAGSDYVFPSADVSGLTVVRDRVVNKICSSQPPPKDYPCGEFRGIDLAFVMNTQSAGGHDMVYASDFMQKASSKFEIGPDKTQISVVPAPCKSLPGFELNKYSTKSELIQGMVIRREQNFDSLMTHVTTRTFTAGNGARPKANVTRAIVIVSDGNPSQGTIDKANQAKADGIEVFVVGVGKVRTNALKEMASKPSKIYYHPADSYEELVSNPQIIDGITATICQRAGSN